MKNTFTVKLQVSIAYQISLLRYQKQPNALIHSCTLHRSKLYAYNSKQIYEHSKHEKFYYYDLINWINNGYALQCISANEQSKRMPKEPVLNISICNEISTSINNYLGEGQPLKCDAWDMRS